MGNSSGKCRATVFVMYSCWIIGVFKRYFKGFWVYFIICCYLRCFVENLVLPKNYALFSINIFSLKQCLCKQNYILKAWGGICTLLDGEKKIASFKYLIYILNHFIPMNKRKKEVKCVSTKSWQLFVCFISQTGIGTTTCIVSYAHSTLHAQ